MGLVVDEDRAFSVCHGYNIDHELLLWSPGVVGALNDEQEKKCKSIIVENAKGGIRKFNSVEEALGVKTVGIPKGHLHQVIAIRQCAGVLDRAEDMGVIKNIDDVFDLMDYCMEKMGHPGTKRRIVRPEIKKFVTEQLTRKL